MILDFDRLNLVKTLKWNSILIMILFVTFPCFAQHTITGRVINEDGDPLIYAQIVLLNPADSTLQYFDVADDKGIYEIKRIRPGQYLMQFSFAAKEIIYKSVTIPSESGKNLGDTVMKPALTEEVVVTADYVPIQIKQDTVSFNAKAFKTKKDAVVEDLLKKLPGIEVDKSGNMKALGEDVERVLVDGKEFFGKDPKIATKNLPAKAVDKVQIFDKKSEEAEFMGIDDGVRERTINLMLNEDHKKGYFGEMEAGGGTKEHYKASGKIYRFSSKLQSALLGMNNNINDFGYTDERHKDWGKQVSGRNTSVAGGLNLSYNKSKINRYFGSYLISSTKTILDQRTSTENFLKTGSYDQVENLAKDERNTPHKANFGVRHHFNKKHNLIIDGDLSLTTNNRETHTWTQTHLNDSLVNSLDNLRNSHSDQLNFSVKGVDIIKLNRENTQIKTDIDASYDKSASEMDWTNRTMSNTPDRFTPDDDFQDDQTDNLTISVNPILVQKIRPMWYLNTSFRMRLNNSNLNRSQGSTGQQNDSGDSLKAEMNTRELIFNPSLSLERNTSEYRLRFNLGARWNQFDKTLDNHSIGESGYFYILPGIHFNRTARKGRHIHVSYQTNVNMPTVNQLLPVLNTVNLLSLYQGNLELIPEYRHTISSSYWLFDYFSFTSLFVRVSGSYTQDKISWSQTTDRDLVSSITPVNVPYQASASSYISFSTPIQVMGLKVNIVSHENLSRGITMINSEENVQTNLTHTFGLNFENRRKQIVDIRFGGSVSMTDSKFSIDKLMNSIYYNTQYYTDIRFTPNEQWTFDTEINVANYDSESFTEAVNIPVINAGFSYYFMGEKATLTLYGSDLLNKNIGFRRTSAANYLMEQEWNTIGRYVMLSLKWRVGK